ncbi:MAG: EAL domain-containing protein [Candidatus Obscuribacterales bacterium]|nr:EAL domain-containing protein [Candidatus Obscuribacterales bacterium]
MQKSNTEQRYVIYNLPLHLELMNATSEPKDIHDLISNGTKYLRSANLPIFKIENLEICGYELLIRGTGKFRSPAELFPAAAAVGRLEELDLAALAISLEGMRELPHNMQIHVNLFAETILATDINKLIMVLKQNDKNGANHSMCVELIETPIMPRPEDLLLKIRALQNAGIEIAIDDVGCGASSVEVLVLLEPAIFKIDRNYVTRAYDTPESRRRYLRLVKIAKSLDCKIVAEGIDTDEDRRHAFELGIEMGQGLLTGPLPQ